MATHQVIVGGGPAATNAIEAIRQFDSEGSQITLVSDEPAHSRMALPYWLAGQIEREHTHTADDAYLQRMGVTARIGLRAERLDTDARKLELSDGSSLDYDNLLIATGSSPVAPPLEGLDLPGVQPMWSLAHTASALDAVASLDKPRVVLVGAGFIGFIVLNAMFKRGWDLAVVEREPHVLPRMLNETAAGVVEAWLASRNVEVRAGASVTRISQTSSGRKLVELDSGRNLEADLVIVATGIRANTELVEGTAIETDQAILVDDQLQTNVPGVYAAGDVAQGPSLLSDQREVHAIQPTAVDHGRVAGANMAGQTIHYPGSLIMNVVDVCGLQTASYGEWDSADGLVISNPRDHIYRKLCWADDRIIGAIFTGRPQDSGMLTDLGMVKGLIQTKTALGAWKEYLERNPFDIRRAFVACGVAGKLVKTTLLGQPSRHRDYRYQGEKIASPASASHHVYVSTKDR